MKIKTCLLAGLILAIPAVNAKALVATDLPLEEKVAHSDAVLIGTVTSIAGERGDRFAVVKVGTVLKGKAADTIAVFVDVGIAELTPDCCDVGGKYLFFLLKGYKNRYEIFDGRYGRYRVD
jgi:hypothetical protein